jgi:hypothetical protein
VISTESNDERLELVVVVCFHGVVVVGERNVAH